MTPLKRTYVIMETLQSTANDARKKGKYSLMETHGKDLKLVRRSDHLHELEIVMGELSQPQTAEEYRYELQRMRDVLFDVQEQLGSIANGPDGRLSYGELERMRNAFKLIKEKVKETEWVYNNPSPVFPDTIDEEAELWRK